ncbi:tenascin-N [Syngnathoides biaculeatus]|uniref:tenascin-N n=1 Tax=Syngnathoides biaculeatus TaxID=300417 RepID=UPI002ADDAF78|nr:tenascin-N [Syngnathoides biaculeatus]
MTTKPRWRALLALVCTVSHCSFATTTDSAAPEQAVTFSHVYNIDIPGGAACKLERLPRQDEKGLQMESTKIDENDIIFRHNIRLQSPKCDCGESEAFKSLLYRVNGLEEEVNYLKSQCAQGCCGGGGAIGVDTNCNDRGTYQQETCSCLCYPGWEGPDCSVSSCVDECNDNGRCVDRKCVCHQGYTGEDCSELMCPNNCNDKGRCVEGQCVCFPHFTGDDCGVQKCPNDCSRNGLCFDGQCVCDQGFYGEDCSLALSPQGLRLVQATDVSLLVQWSPVPGADYYVLTYHPRGQGSALKQVQVPNRDSSYLLTGLDSGLTYFVEVQAVIRGIQSGADEIEAATAVSTVSDIRVLDRTDVSIQVDWSNPQAEVDHFRLTHTDPSGQEEELSVQPSQEARTKHTIMGLYPGTEYLIAVQAIKGPIEGNSSTVTSSTNIDAPTNLVTTEATEDTATVSWDPVQAQIEGYMLTYTSDSGSSGEIPIGRDMTSYTLVGLKPGVVYNINIWAFRGNKVSPKSFTVAETEMDVPTNLLAQKETESSLKVSWDGVHAEIDGYVLTYSSPDGLSEEIPLGPDSRTYTIKGLRSGVVYTVHIRAVKGNKVSKKVSTQAETELDAPANLLVHDETESSFRVSWEGVHAEIDGYMLKYRSPDGSSEEILVGPHMSTYTIRGLKPGVTYTVRIWAVKGNKASGKVSTQAQTELDAPANLLAHDETESSFKVSWDGVQAEIDGYVLTYSSSEGFSGEISLGPDTTSYSLTGLRPGTMYTIYIWAVKGSKLSRKISTQVETELDAPANLLAHDETESSFKVSWDGVQAEIDGYVLTYSSSEGFSGEISLGPDTTSYSLTALRPGVVYTIYIWAIKGSKLSRKISTQAETELDDPANLLARDQTESSFTVSWDGVKAEIDGYVLTHTSSEGSSGEIRIGAESDSYSLTGLRPGVIYTVYIWAIKGDRPSRKISVKAETDIDAPKDLRALGVTTESATLSWAAPSADIEGYVLTYRDEDGNAETVEKQLGPGETSFAVSSLQMATRYTVTVVAYRGSKRSKAAETSFKTVGLMYPFPMDCLQIMKNGIKKSGIYTTYINNDRSKPIDAYCDMDTDGGGWLVLQRRTTGKLDFLKRWRQYVAGFGNMADEFWIGLEKIHQMTDTATQYEVRFDLGLGSERAYAVYDSFKVGSSRQKFALAIGNYRGTAGDAMTYHQGRPWTTVDSDNDIALGNCALTHRGAWWYKNCHLANLNGKWGDNRHSLGVNWEPWKGHLVSLDFTEMKIRPAGAFSSRKRRSLKVREKNQQNRHQVKSKTASQL